MTLANSEKQTNSISDTMTQIELMQFLKVSNTGFWRLDRAGQLPPSFRVGSRRRWNRETVRKWMADQERQSSKQ